MYFSLFLYNLVLFFFTASYFLHTFIIYVTHIGINFAKHTERYLSQNNFSRIFQNLTVILHQFNIERVPFLFFFFHQYIVFPLVLHTNPYIKIHGSLAFVPLHAYFILCVFLTCWPTLSCSPWSVFFLIHFQEKCDPLIVGGWCLFLSLLLSSKY